MQPGPAEIGQGNAQGGKHKSVDDRPFGGGPGMVIMPEPVYAAVEDIQQRAAEPGTLILLTPAGERLTQAVVQELASHKRLLLLCGRYEGFDERIAERSCAIFIGDFICNGGEVPAMVVIDTVIRYVPGVLGDEESVKEESHSEPGALGISADTWLRVSRHGSAGDIAEWRSRGHRSLAAGALMLASGAARLTR